MFNNCNIFFPGKLFLVVFPISSGDTEVSEGVGEHKLIAGLRGYTADDRGIDGKEVRGIESQLHHCIILYVCGANPLFEEPHKIRLFPIFAFFFFAFPPPVFACNAVGRK